MKMSTVVTEILVTLICLCSNVQCMIVTKPNDAAAKVGDIVNMRCSSSYVNDPCGKITWKHFKINSQSGDYITNEGELSPAVRSYISLINSSVGNCDFSFSAVKSSAGLYQCIDPTSSLVSAQLIVLESNPEVEVIKQSPSNNIAMRCSVNYYGNWVPKVQWVKVVGDSSTNVASNDSETSKSPVSSLIHIPSATFDLTGATEYFICIVTIPQPGGSNMPIYTWHSLKNDTTWRKKTDFNQVSCDGFGIYIGFLGFFVISTLICIGVIVFTWRKLTIERQRSQAMGMVTHAE